MLFSEVGQCRYQWKWIGRALKHCHSRWDHLDIVFRRSVITTSGIRPPSWYFWVKKASGEVGMWKTYPTKNIGIATEIALISVSVVKSLVLPVWGTVSASDLYLIAVLRSRTMSVPVELDRPSPKTVVAADITLISLPVTFGWKLTHYYRHTTGYKQHATCMIYIQKYPA